MVRELFITLLIASLIITWATPRAAAAGGAGGEPMIRDSVGWGSVAATVILGGIYIIYQGKQNISSDKGEVQSAVDTITPVKADTSNRVTPSGELIVARW